MVDLEEIKLAAQKKTDEQGKPVIQIPLELWEEWLAGQKQSQRDRVAAALADWDRETNELPASWWSEFEAFLKANRLDLS
jgi:hypothetical protein